MKFQIFCRWFSFGGEVLRILETWILDAQNHVANCGRLDPWQGLVEPRKGIAEAPAEAPKKEVPTEVRASPLVPATWRSTRDPPKHNGCEDRSGQCPAVATYLWYGDQSHKGASII